MAPRKPKSDEPKGDTGAADQPPIMKAKPVAGRFPTKRDLEHFLTNANRYAEQAKEASGDLGNHTAQFVENWKVEKTSLGWVRKLSRMDRAKQSLVLGHFLAMIDVLGLNNTDTLLGDDAVAGQPDKEAGDAMDEMTGAGSDDEARDLRPGFLRTSADEPPAPPVH